MVKTQLEQWLPNQRGHWNHREVLQQNQTAKQTPKPDPSSFEYFRAEHRDPCIFKEASWILVT